MLEIKRQFNNVTDKINSIAKSSEYYMSDIGNDEELGFSYKYWLSDKIENNQDLSKMKDLDFSNLDVSNKFLYLQREMGDISDEDFYKNFNTTEKYFKQQYGSIEGYFDKVRENYEKRATYENMSNVSKSIAGIGLAGAQLANGVYSTIEGVTDLFLTVAAWIAPDGGTEEAIKDLIEKDLTGTGYLQEQINQMGHDYVYWDNKWNAWKIVGDMAYSIGQMYVMMLTGGGSKAANIIGQGIYYGAMAGSTVEESLNSNENLTIEQASINAAIQTGIEMLTERFSPNPLLGIKGFKATSGGTTLASRIAFAMAGEASEEVVSEWLSAPIQTYFNNYGKDELDPTYQKLDFAEILENSLYAGLIGGLTGGLLEGIHIAGTTKIDGLNKSQTAAFNQLYSDAATVLKSFDANNVENFRIENNLDSKAMNELKAGTYSDVKLQKQYNSALEADTKSADKVVDMMGKLSSLCAKIGYEKFNKAFQLANETAKSKVEAAKLVKDTIDPDVEGLVTITNHKSEINSINNRKNGKNTFVPIVHKSTFKSYDNAKKLAKVIKMFTGADVIFGSYINKKTNIIDKHAPTAQVLKDGTMLIDLNSFETLSRSKFIEQIFTSKIVDKMLKTNSNILSEELIVSLRNCNPIFKSMNNSQILQAIITDPRTTALMFGLNKKASKKIFEQIDKESKFKTGEYKKLIKYIKSKMSEGVLRYTPTEDRENVASSLNMDNEFVTEFMKRNPSTPAGITKWAYVRTDMSDHQAVAYQATVDLKRSNMIPEVWDQEDIDYSRKEYYNKDFVEYLYDRYGTPDFLNNLNNYLYDEYGIIYYPRDNVFLKPFDVYQMYNLEAYRNDAIKKLSDGPYSNQDLKKIELSMANYINLDYANSLGLPQSVIDTLKNVKIGFRANSNLSEDGAYNYSKKKIYINIGFNFNRNIATLYFTPDMGRISNLETVAHELVHRILETQDLPKGSTVSDEIINAISTQYKSSGFVDKIEGDRLYIYWKNIPIGSIDLKKVSKENLEREKYRAVARFMYWHTLGELAANFKGKEELGNTRNFGSEGLFSKNGFIRTKDNKIKGFGKFKGINIDLGQEVVTSSSSINENENNNFIANIQGSNEIENIYNKNLNLSSLSRYSEKTKLYTDLAKKLGKDINSLTFEDLSNELGYKMAKAIFDANNQGLVAGVQFIKNILSNGEFDDDPKSYKSAVEIAYPNAVYKPTSKEDFDNYIKEVISPINVINYLNDINNILSNKSFTDKEKTEQIKKILGWGKNIDIQPDSYFKENKDVAFRNSSGLENILTEDNTLVYNFNDFKALTFKVSQFETDLESKKSNKEKLKYIKDLYNESMKNEILASLINKSWKEIDLEKANKSDRSKITPFLNIKTLSYENIKQLIKNLNSIESFAKKEEISKDSTISGKHDGESNQEEVGTGKEYDSTEESVFSGNLSDFIDPISRYAMLRDQIKYNKKYQQMVDDEDLEQEKQIIKSEKTGEEITITKLTKESLKEVSKWNDEKKKKYLKIYKGEDGQVHTDPVWLTEIYTELKSIRKEYLKHNNNPTKADKLINSILSSIFNFGKKVGLIDPIVEIPNNIFEQLKTKDAQLDENQQKIDDIKSNLEASDIVKEEIAKEKSQLKKLKTKADSKKAIENKESPKAIEEKTEVKEEPKTEVKEEPKTEVKEEPKVEKKPINAKKAALASTEARRLQDYLKEQKEKNDQVISDAKKDSEFDEKDIDANAQLKDTAKQVYAEKATDQNKNWSNEYKEAKEKGGREAVKNLLVDMIKRSTIVTKEAGKHGRFSPVTETTQLTELNIPYDIMIDIMEDADLRDVLIEIVNDLYKGNINLGNINHNISAIGLLWTDFLSLKQDIYYEAVYKKIITPLASQSGGLLQFYQKINRQTDLILDVLADLKDIGADIDIIVEYFKKETGLDFSKNDLTDKIKLTKEAKAKAVKEKSEQIKKSSDEEIKINQQLNAISKKIKELSGVEGKEEELKKLREEEANLTLQKAKLLDELSILKSEIEEEYKILATLQDITKGDNIPRKIIETGLAILEKKNNNIALTKAEKALLKILPMKEIENSLKKGLSEKKEEIETKVKELAAKEPKMTKIYRNYATWKYMAMLSSPSTWIKNIVSNELVNVFDRFALTIMDSAFIKKLDINESVWEEKLGDEFGTITYYTPDSKKPAGYRKQIQYKLSTKDVPVELKNYVNAFIYSEEMHNQKAKHKNKYLKTNEKTSLVQETANEVIKKKSFLSWYKDTIDKWLNKADNKVILNRTQKIMAALINSNIKTIYEDVMSILSMSNLPLDERAIAFRDLLSTYDVNNLTGTQIANIAAAMNYLSDIDLYGIKDIFLDYSYKTSEKTFFRNRNKVGEIVEEASKKHPYLMLPIKILLPFANMSWNMTVAMFQLSPLGFVKVITHKHMWNRMVDSLAEAKTNSAEQHKVISDIFDKLQEFNVSTAEELKTRISELETNLETDNNAENRKELETLNKLALDLDIAAKKIKDYNKVIQKVFDTEPANVKDYQSDEAAQAITGFNSIELRRRAAKATIGTVMYFVGFLLKALGVLDKDEDDYMGIILNIAGLKVRLSDINPVASPIILGASTWDVIKGENFDSAVSSLAEALLEDGIAEPLTDAIKYSDDPLEFMLNTLSNFGTQLIPTVIKKVNAIFSQSKKNKSTSPFKRAWENIADATPILRDIVLSNKIDPYTGEVAKKHDLSYIGIMIVEAISLFSPIKIVYRNPNSIKHEAASVDAQATQATGRITVNKKQYQLPRKQLEQYQRYRAEYINKNLTKLINSSIYKKSTNEDKKKLIKALYTKATESTKSWFLKNNKLQDSWLITK